MWYILVWCILFGQCYCVIQPAEDLQENTVEETDDKYREEDLEHIQKEVEELQGQFDDAVVNKHRLGTQLNSMKERLKAATNMVEGYVDFLNHNRKHQ